MNKISVLETAQSIIEMANEIESLKLENVNLRDRLIHAQSETLAAIQQNETKPEPRDIGHENVASFVTRKSGELQVSPGIVWGLVMDLISKNPDHFGIDADACPEPVEPIDGTEPKSPRFKVGDKIRVVRDLYDPKRNGFDFTIRSILAPVNKYGYLYEVRENVSYRFYESEIEPYTERP